MKATHFEDLIIWQEAVDLYEMLYVRTQALRAFHYREQLHRAALSISNNIAEGFESGYESEFARFLRIAKRSCGEVRSMVHVGVRIRVFTAEEGEAHIQRCRKLSVMIHNLIRTLS